MWPGSSDPRVAGISMMTFSEAGSMSEFASTVKRETRLNQLAGRVMLHAALNDLDLIDAEAVEAVAADLEADLPTARPAPEPVAEPALEFAPRPTPEPRAAIPIRRDDPATAARVAALEERLTKWES